MDEPPAIDAHQHFWTLGRGDYGWLAPAAGPIYRDFGPGDLAPLLARAGVSRTVLVQAAPTEAETHFLLGLAARTTFVAGVVGWVDFDTREAADRVSLLARRPKLVGLRPMIQDLPDDDWMLRPQLGPAIEAMVDAALCFDALVKPRHLPVLHRFAHRYPELRIVIDHGAKPDIKGGDLAAWRRDLRAIAAGADLVCKLSGLLTEAAPGAGVEDLRPVVETLIEAFGPERLMWGSDWPVLNLNGDYAGWRGMAEALTTHLSPDERAAIFGGTAQRFYGLPHDA